MSQIALIPDLNEGEGTRSNATANRLDASDRVIHDWYRFVLSFPPHLVRAYLDRFGLTPGQTVLDPFCGTGTTVVEAQLHGIGGVGVEANALAHFASSVKTDWAVDPDELLECAQEIAKYAGQEITANPAGSLRTLGAEAESLLLKDSISPLPLHKALVLLEAIAQAPTRPCHRHLRLALARTLVYDVSNLHFGPEVGVRRIKLEDAPVIECWLAAVQRMAGDLRAVDRTTPPTVIHHADARRLTSLLQPRTIDAVFTSPPYPNEKDYTRATRLESVVLGLIKNKGDLRAIKQGLLRSNSRNVYKHDDDDRWIAHNAEIQALAAAIEQRRIELGKTSGFEKMYARVTRHYFGGMARHLAELRPFLKPGAYLGYVVGDQASFFQVLIQTGRLLADIAAELGYEVVGIDLFRTRLATATKQQMREEVVVLRWPESVTEQAPEGYEWVIRSIGKAQYRFALVEKARIAPSKMLAETKILDATPGIIARYAISDEQGLLARLRYNRLIDIFTGVTCYSLQNHLRTSVNGIGQVETDELYIGVDRRGAHYVFPVQAKGGSDKPGVVQIEQDFAMCAQKFPGLICKPIAAQFADPSLIVLFAFEQTTDGLRIVAERHYRLVDAEELSNEEIAVYQTRPE